MRSDIADFRGISGIKADKHFFRLHRPFHDAVRSGKLSAIIEVLLRAQLSGDRARRTAEKILADERRRRLVLTSDLPGTP
jgi:hypothetical protein